ncbi:MAG: CocE/NonD family hydrolase [Thermotaleaceae bacterium]
MVGNTFRLYRSGIHLADVIFEEGRIIYRYRDIYTNCWQEPEVYREEENIYNKKYDMDLIAVRGILEEMEGSMALANEESLKLKDGCIYYKQEEIKKNLGHQTLWIQTWAQRHKRFPLDFVTVDNKPVGFVVPRREDCTVLVKTGYEEFTPQGLWMEESLSKCDYTIDYLGTTMVKMEDGIGLATDIWLPKGKFMESRFPTIFIRTPYGKQRVFESQLRFVQRGYALVVQDVRGREASEGDFASKPSEKEDGDAALNWIAQQEWCDGNIGMIGGSYLGFVQWAAASNGNPHLKAIVSIVTAGSPFVDLPRKGGTMASGVLAWSFAMAEKNFHPEAMVRDDWEQILKLRPIQDIPQKVLGKNIPFWDEYMKHNTNDEFWEQSSWRIHGDKIKVPALIVSGWFDDNGQGSLEAWKMNAEFGRKNIKMVLGPWMHKANSTRDIGEISFGNNALRYDLDLMFLKWFDRHLKGVENGIDIGLPVEYYCLGSNQWKKAKQWSPEKVIWQKWYIDSKGKAKGSHGDGCLTKEREYHSLWDSYLYNPQEPVPQIIDISDNELNTPANYKEIEKRQDVLVYTSEILEDDLTIAGEIYADIYAASTARDTDWLLRLTDVDEEGNSFRLVDGIYRAKYANDFKEEKPLTPGEIRKYRINMFHIANTFKKGHRIRLQVTSSAENLVFPNHNTGNDFATDTEYVIAEQKIYHGEGYESCIYLPVLKE